jgi:hypothetical protein
MWERQREWKIRWVIRQREGHGNLDAIFLLCGYVLGVSNQPSCKTLIRIRRQEKGNIRAKLDNFGDLDHSLSGLTRLQFCILVPRNKIVKVCDLMIWIVFDNVAWIPLILLYLPTCVLNLLVLDVSFEERHSDPPVIWQACLLICIWFYQDPK